MNGTFASAQRAFKLRASCNISSVVTPLARSCTTVTPPRIAAATMGPMRSGAASPASASKYRRSAARRRSASHSCSIKRSRRVLAGRVQKPDLQSPLVPTPRDGPGGLNEASRLLQEGLQLLDARTREVEVLVREAKERAREIVLNAEDKAREIGAQSERQRIELEEQLAALRTELDGVRAELATLRATPANAPPPKEPEQA